MQYIRVLHEKVAQNPQTKCVNEFCNHEVHEDTIVTGIWPAFVPRE